MTRLRTRTGPVLAACALALALASEAGAQGCAMCGTVGQGKDDPLVQGLFASILFMVSMPAALVLAVGGWFFYRLRHGEPDEPALDDERGDPGARVVEFRRE